MWLLAAFFLTQVRVPLPGVARVGIVEGRLIALSEDSTGTVLARQGKADFRAVAKFAAGPHPSGLAIGDVDGDGKPDLIIAHHEEKFLTIAFGGDYSRSAQVQVPEVAPHLHSVAAADLDGDGKIDLVVNDMAGRRVLILWGKGDGTFEAAAGIPTGSKGYAYFNVAVAGDRLFVPTWPQPQLAVLRAHKRSIAPEALLDLPNPSFYVAIAGPDVAVVTYSGSVADGSRDGLLVFPNGRGPPRSYPTGHAPTSVATGDIDGDGAADLAVCNQGGNSVTVLVRGRAETLVAPHPLHVALGDLDGDGKADLAVAAQDEVWIFLTR